MRTAAKINTYIADTNFFNTLLKVGKGKYLFEPPKMLRKKVPEGDIVAEAEALRKPDEVASSTTPIGEGGLEFGSTIVSDGPLNGYKTTPEIAKALENISNSKQNADMLSSLYYKVFLGPKAFTQEAKTPQTLLMYHQYSLTSNSQTEQVNQ